MSRHSLYWILHTTGSQCNCFRAGFRSIQIRLEAPGRSDARPLAERQGHSLRRHSYLSASRVLRQWSRPWGRCNVRARHFPQGREICGHWTSLRFRTNCDRDFGHSQHVSSCLCLVGGLLMQVSGEAREAIFLFQRCSVLMQHFNDVLLHDSLPVIDCDHTHFCIFL